MSPLLRFSMVGVVGFVVDGGVLQLLVSLAGTDALLARAVSLPLAVWATWALNRRFTFDASTPAWPSFCRYVVVSLGGAGVNLCAYTALVLSSSAMAARPVIALGIASVIALSCNSLGSKHYAFRRRA